LRSAKARASGGLAVKDVTSEPILVGVERLNAPRNPDGSKLWLEAACVATHRRAEADLIEVAGALGHSTPKRHSWPTNSSGSAQLSHREISLMRQADQLRSCM
jgi:hypothetical protein